MPFQFEEIVERFKYSIQGNRLAHAYLMTGGRREELERLARNLADVALEASHRENPDFYWVQPESKSRRIRIEQIRQLEGALYLKAYRAPRKVAVILDADRMCMGQAEAANAFLKTLEEPPVKTLLLLLTTHPQGLLPTILSRCIRMDLQSTGENPVDPVWEEFLTAWKEIGGSPAIRAYRRSQLLGGYWQGLREQVEETYKEALKNADDEETENGVKALIEAESLNARNQSLSDLQRWYWSQGQGRLQAGEDLLEAVRGVELLSQLQSALQGNLDAGLALERALLAMEGVIPVAWRSGVPA